ncbi:MAG TPA: DNA repair protein RecN [Parvularculaceae bacterium]|nr:DNA repair protein RecN [Amphiplicatus sp.]MCB9956018.1 DNA repair protein RecN [Caulobacterales bacterium]HPE30946.1 DNA repair protein RecN [Parvularculaceae bacterium]
MLTALHIQNFVLIDQAALPLGQGLTALTGETGAGKSILLDALGLAAGGRTERGAVRLGAEQGVVTASFEVGADHPAFAILKENGLDAGDDQIILRRIQMKDGRSRAFVNDQPVSIALLKQVGETLVEIHGQHDGRGFLTAATHRSMLDEFAGLDQDVRALSNLWRVWREAHDALEERRAGRDKALAEADYLRHVVDELSALGPEEGEEAKLAERRAELQAAEKIAEDLVAAANLLAEDGLEGKLGACARRLARASGSFPAEGNPLTAPIERIEAALSEFMEARAAVEEAVERLGADPKALEKAEERLFALRAAARKHGVAPDALQRYLAAAEEKLGLLDSGEAGFGALEKTLAAAESAYRAFAEKVSAKRRKAAKTLDAAVEVELGPLKLGKAKFRTEIMTDPGRPGVEGIDQVEFMVATNPGAPPGPLKTIASGGELSRFVLAMKAALAAKENRTVIIFDEVDAGVGGAVADAVGERLARLARDAQVLVVTHSPQVAARAKAHWRVTKHQTDTDTTTTLEVLSAEERIEEIARMLSGARVTDAAREAARQLLEGAGAPAAAAPRKRKRA